MRSLAASASAWSRVIPARENRVKYGDTPPTERAHPARCKTSAEDFPSSEPSTPGGYADQARIFDTSTIRLYQRCSVAEEQLDRYRFSPSMRSKTDWTATRPG